MKLRSLFVVAALLFVQISQAYAQETSELELGASTFLLGPTAVVDKDGSVRLANSVLLTDEVGAADYRQQEKLSDQVHAKKIFVLEDNRVSSALLLLFGSAKQVVVNGKPIGPSSKLPSTGWNQIEIPVDLLKRGENEIIVRAGGGLLVDSVQSPGRSFKSTDGGRTWSQDNLTTQAAQQGEYVIRLRLGRHAPKGWAMSPVFDLWRQGNGIGRPAQLVRFAGLADLEAKQPTGTRVQAYLRTGPTPQPPHPFPRSPRGEGKWTSWQRLSHDVIPGPKEQGHRWGQLKFDMETTSAMVSPRIPPSLFIDCSLTPEKSSADDLKVTNSSVLPRTSVPFVYDQPSPRLKLLRERYRLDDVIAPGQTELEKLMLLRHWVRNQWHTAWSGTQASWMPPWDAHIILENKDHSDCLTMCTHYAAVYTQCCQALGWNARHCILDHHCVSEVWMDDLTPSPSPPGGNGKRGWVMMDPGNSAKRPDANLHYERDGVPMSALELHLAYTSGNTKGILVRFTPAKLAAQIAKLCRPAPKNLPARPDVVTLDELEEYPVCQIQNFRRYGFPARNNFLATLYPGELYQGLSAYFYDGYCWVGDSRDGPKISPEYSMLLDPGRPSDIDWPLNQTAIHLSRTAKPSVLRVDLETSAPNLARFEKNDNGAWKSTPSSFLWQLQAGGNELTVRSVNAWEKSGRAAAVKIER